MLIEIVPEYERERRDEAGPAGARSRNQRLRQSRYGGRSTAIVA
jgi:hypothetical protein